MFKKALIVLFSAGILSAQAPPLLLDIRVSTETVPAGSMAQIKVYLGSPQPISYGKIVLAFGGAKGYIDSPPPVQAATVFSAMGDVSAVGQVDLGGTFTLIFSSPSAGVGRLPGVPIMEFSIPVGNGLTVALFTGSGFSGPAGNYVMTGQPGGAVVGGTLSIETATPTGSSGTLPAGSILTIAGTGFQNTTAVLIEGVSVASVNIASSSLITVTLAGATEITGKQIVISNPDGEQVTYWGGLGASPYYTLPLSPTSLALCELMGPPLEDTWNLVVQNPNPVAAQVTITDVFNPGPGAAGQLLTVTIPSGGTYETYLSDPPDSTVRSDPSTPVRIMYFLSYPFGDPAGIYPVVSQAAPVPLIGSIVSAASQAQAAVSLGEIVTIYGVNMGPVTPAGVTLDSFGNVGRNLNSVQVLFDGIPAPLLYVSASQLNAVVPYEIYPDTVTALQVEYNGVVSAAWGVPVAAVAPAIFTLNSSGQGAAAVLNQDNTVNSPANPAQPGSILQIFATGEGLTGPAATTGVIVDAGSLRSPLLPVSVTIGGENALVLYPGSAPGSVAGLFQVNAQVPKDLAPNSAVAVVLTVGSVASQPAVTVALK